MNSLTNFSVGFSGKNAFFQNNINLKKRILTRRISGPGLSAIGTLGTLFIFTRKNIDEQDSEGETLLMHEAEIGNLEAVKRLLELNANPDILNDLGKTALMKACDKRRFRVVETLISARANITFQDTFKATALMRAANSGCARSTSRLINAGAQIEYQGIKGKTPLLHASELANFGAVRALIAAKANVNHRDTVGYTPILRAVAAQNKINIDATEVLKRRKIVKALLEAGAEMTSERHSALVIALNKGYTDILKDLLKAGASFGFKDYRGNSPLSVAYEKGGELLKIIEIAKVFRQKKLEEALTDLLVTPLVSIVESYFL